LDELEGLLKELIIRSVGFCAPDLRPANPAASIISYFTSDNKIQYE
jgi:hypothetical protein